MWAGKRKPGEGPPPGDRVWKGHSGKATSSRLSWALPPSFWQEPLVPPPVGTRRMFAGSSLLWTLTLGHRWGACVSALPRMPCNCLLHNRWNSQDPHSHSKMRSPKSLEGPICSVLLVLICQTFNIVFRTLLLVFNLWLVGSSQSFSAIYKLETFFPILYLGSFSLNWTAFCQMVFQTFPHCVPQSRSTVRCSCRGDQITWEGKCHPTWLLEICHVLPCRRFWQVLQLSRLAFPCFLACSWPGIILTSQEWRLPWCWIDLFPCPFS